MKQSTFNNLNQEILYEVIFNLCELGFSDPFIVDLLSNYSSEKIKRYVNAARKTCNPVPQNECCHQKSLLYLARLCVKSESEAMTQAETVLKDFLWERMKFCDLRDYITGLITGHYYLTHMDVPEKDIFYARLIEMIFDISFVNTRENRENHFSVTKFITEYLVFMNEQSMLSHGSWRHSLPVCIGDVRTQMAQFLAHTKSSLCTGTGLMWESNRSKSLIHKVLNALTHQERMVVILRFGLDDGVLIGCDQVAKELKINTDYVRNIEARALEKLSQPLQREMLKQAITLY